jgi:RNA polymerase sigma-70 factor (ECF subfamily)
MPSEMASSALTEAPDSILVAASKRGESGTFRVLVERYQAKIFSVALHVTRNREDAEDVVQSKFSESVYSFARVRREIVFLHMVDAHRH